MDFDARTLAWVEANFGYYLETKGWESPAQLWDHILDCDSCSIGGDDTYIEDNPAKPVQGPPVPRELWSPMERAVYDAYMPSLREHLKTPTFMAGDVIYAFERS